MLRSITSRWATTAVAAVCVALAAFLVVTALGVGRHHARPAASAPYTLTPFASYEARAPHVLSTTVINSDQGAVQGAAATPPSALPPLPASLEVDDPPADSGILGSINDPDVLTVTIAFGASLFDKRYGLGPQRPRELIKMPTFSADGEPAWATGGTYQVARIIRQHVEFWDRVGLNEQENMIGRVRTTGAPLGGTSEFEEPRYDIDPQGKRIPLDAHIRLANPRTSATEDQRILRRGFNYTRGFDTAGQLDQGLMFVAFNQSPERQFATIQERLSAEPMIDYITPVGGGYFFAPLGARSESDWVGSGLFAA